MPPTFHRPEQHSDPGRAPATWVEAPRRGPYPTTLGTLGTCPVHYWSGPNLSITADAAPVCWETGHVQDDSDLRAVLR